MRWQTHTLVAPEKDLTRTRCIMGRPDKNRPSQPAPQPSQWHHFTPDQKALATSLVRCYVGDKFQLVDLEGSPADLYLRQELNETSPPADTILDIVLASKAAVTRNYCSCYNSQKAEPSFSSSKIALPLEPAVQPHQLLQANSNPEFNLCNWWRRF